MRGLFGITALMWVSEEGNINTVKALLEKGADINQKNYSGETALTLASKQGNIKIFWQEVW